MRLDPQQLPITETSLSSYFSKRLTRYARRLRPPPHEDTCWYLGSLLERFGRNDELFSYQDGHVTLRPLALLYSDAIQANNSRERCLMLQQLGDMALFHLCRVGQHLHAHARDGGQRLLPHPAPDHRGGAGPLPALAQHQRSGDRESVVRIGDRTHRE